MAANLFTDSRTSNHHRVCEGFIEDVLVTMFQEALMLHFLNTSGRALRGHWQWVGRRCTWLLAPCCSPDRIGEKVCWERFQRFVGKVLHYCHKTKIEAKTNFGNKIATGLTKNLRCCYCCCGSCCPCYCHS